MDLFASGTAIQATPMDISAAGLQEALLWQRRWICSRLGLQFRQGSWALGFWQSHLTCYVQFNWELHQIHPMLRMVKVLPVLPIGNPGLVVSVLHVSQICNSGLDVSVLHVSPIANPGLGG
jgi:hypothetical protein